MLEREIWGNTAADWLLAIGVTILSAVVFKLVVGLLTRRMAKFSRKTKTTLDDLVADMLGRTKLFLLLVIAADIGVRMLVLPAAVSDVIEHIAIVAVLLQTGIWGNVLLRYTLGNLSQTREGDEAYGGAAAALGVIGRIVVWVVILLLILDNLGVNITALIAGLGIGGIAIALALQNILGDLFASLTIILDKPFVVGDSISIDAFFGTVEHIGLKTTRLRSLSGEQLVFSNADLLKSRIRNFKRMEERRVVSVYTLDHELGAEKLGEVPGILRDIVGRVPAARFERAHLRDIGLFGVNIELVYHIETPDYAVFMDSQQSVNLAVKKRFSEAGISFARSAAAAQQQS